MKTKVLLTVSAALLTVGISACSGPAPAGNTSNTNTNAAKPANTASNTAVNSTSSSNTATIPSTNIIKLEEGGLQMALPMGFKYTQEGGDLLVSTADEGVAVRFSVPADGDYDKAVADAAKQLDEYIKDVKVTQQAKPDTVNGLEVMSSFGTGKDEDGKEVGWELTIIKTDKKPVFAISYAEKASAEKHAAELDAFFKSIKKM